MSNALIATFNQMLNGQISTGKIIVNDPGTCHSRVHTVKLNNRYPLPGSSIKHTKINGLQGMGQNNACHPVLQQNLNRQLLQICFFVALTNKQIKSGRIQNFLYCTDYMTKEVPVDTWHHHAYRVAFTAT